jgi:DNA ligase-1
VASAALTGGAAALGAFAVQLFQPVQPMLAGTAESEAEAVAELGECGLELKLDGARVQIHRRGDESAGLFRRTQRGDPGRAGAGRAVLSLPAGELILEGEAIALRPDGTPHPVPDDHAPLRAPARGGAVRESLRLTLFLFDLLFLDGTSLIDRPYRERIALLDHAVPPTWSCAASSPAPPTRPRRSCGRRWTGATRASWPRRSTRPTRRAPRARWLKVKPVRTLDLVVLAAEWGHGRRKGWLSNLHLGARDEATGGFVMLGKTFKG